MGKLTVSAVKAASRPGRHADGVILYLYVKRSGAKSWVQRVKVDGRRHELGLGPYPAVSLAKARRRAADNRALIADGGDPLAHKRKAKVPTFMEAAQLVYEANVERWKTGRHTDRWLQVVENAVPAFGKKGNRPNWARRRARGAGAHLDNQARVCSQAPVTAPHYPGLGGRARLRQPEFCRRRDPRGAPGHARREGTPPNPALCGDRKGDRGHRKLPRQQVREALVGGSSS